MDGLDWKAGAAAIGRAIGPDLRTAWLAALRADLRRTVRNMVEDLWCWDRDLEGVDDAGSRYSVSSVGSCQLVGAND